jgi:tetratricopeptide (TPR) repeat protein
MKKFNIPILILAGFLGYFIAGCASAELTSAKMHIKTEKWEAAETALNEALKTEPTNPEIPFLLGSAIYGRQQKWSEMNEMFDLAVSIDPHKVLAQGGTVAQNIAMVREQYSIDMYNAGANKFNAYKSARGAAGMADLEAAIEYFNTAIEINPAEPQVYDILAACYNETGDDDQALVMINKALELDPDNFNVNLTAGQLYGASGDLETSLKLYEKAVTIDPTNGIVVRLLAQNYYDLDQKEKSLQVYENAIVGEQDNIVKADLYFNLGVLNLQMGDFTKAEDSFLTAYDLNPKDIEALRGIAQTYENAKKWRRAERFYKELIDLDPENPEHYRGVARVLLRQGKPDEAQTYFEQSKDL